MLSLTTAKIQSNIPLSLYIHIPWCVKKCPYCDFNSHESKAKIDFLAYVQALLQDLQQQLCWLQGRQIVSIFIGGGTPSLLPIEYYQMLFDELRRCLPLSQDCEITMEANPATIEYAPFEEYLQVGINRLSLGIQSFQPLQLQALGRIHDDKQAILAILSAQKAGFWQLNVDLMHGLPKQSLKNALSDLQQAIDLGVPHISWYQLTIEPNTVFYRQPPILPNDDTLQAIFELGMEKLLQHGYQQYEVSAWTLVKNPQPSQHNLNYWQFGDYLAIGAGGHGKITTPDGIFRFYKTRLPKDYVKNQQNLGLKAISDDELPFEFMMNVLRLKQGVPQDFWQQRTSIAWSKIALKLQDLQRQGLLDLSNGRLKCSNTGFLFLNQVLEQFF